MLLFLLLLHFTMQSLYNTSRYNMDFDIVAPNFNHGVL